MSSTEAGYLQFAMFNGAVVTADALQVSPLCSGFMFGEGVFETVCVQDSRPMLLDAHQARLAVSLSYIGATPSIPRGELKDWCAKVIEANSLTNGSLKIVVFKDTVGWSEIILARPAAYAAARYETGFCLKTVPGDLRADPLHAVKSLNYLPNLHARRGALDDGFDEAVFIDLRGRVLEGATTNVFVVKDRMVGTPTLQSGILPGVMRASVLQLLGPTSVRERDIALDELLRADEVFVTNALLGVMPVARIDATSYDVRGNSITRSLMTELTNRRSLCAEHNDGSDQRQQTGPT